MVALHNKRLTDHDIFRGVLWTQEQWLAKNEEFSKALEHKRLSDVERFFEVSKCMEQYQSSQPNMRERQTILTRIQPFVKVRDSVFSVEELDYMIEKLRGVNDPVGQSVASKLCDQRKDTAD